ncbi:SAM-dependent methyltransferase [Streptomyces sp. NPDC057623]|uniref:SAM-dependent methyltransferase n=1 Tax=Streptomyces sp. NPDC057623 TaxID=3346187 RepID=UPI0036CABE54
MTSRGRASHGVRSGDEIKEIFPGLVDVALTGLPTADNTHQVAQRVAPDARIVYVDNDPVVLAHASALLTSTPEGMTAFLDADLHAPEAVLDAAAATLDLSRPVALMILNTLGHVADHDRARDLVRRLLAGLPSGSHLVISDSTATSEGMIAASEAYNASGAVPYHVRSIGEIAASSTAVDAYCGMGRKL